MVRKKRVKKDDSGKPEKAEEPKDEEMMACPLRRPDEDGPCDMCSG